MSERREEEEEEQPAPTRSARVPVPNSKFKVDDDEEEEEEEEEEVKIERKPRTKVNHSKAGKQAKIKSSQLRAKKSFENLVNNNNENEEEPATTRLVQPSKILIPQDGQQPKKWRLADQRRYECNHFFFGLCVFTFF
jgi:beta-lactamase superfamily II metal-dependent hydrolase